MADITPLTMSQLSAAIDNFVSDGITDIVLYISSNGGDTTAGASAFQDLRDRKITLTTYNFGEVNSAAIMVFAAGQIRLSSDLGTFAIHSPYYGSAVWTQLRQLDAGEMEKRLKQQTAVLNRILQLSTKQPPDVVQGWIDNRVNWSAHEALANHFIHDIKPAFPWTGKVVSISNPNPSVIYVPR